MVWGDDRSPDGEMGRLYARYAWKTFREEKWNEFADLTEKGFEFDRLNADLLSFKGILADRENDYAASRQWFIQASLSGTAPEYVSGTEILRRLSELNYRMGYYPDQLSLFQSSSDSDRDHPDILYYTVLSLYQAGEADEAFRYAEEGVYRYQDQRFLILLSGWSGDSRYIGMLREFLDRQGLLYPDLLARSVLQAAYFKDSLALMYVSFQHDLNSWYFRRYILDSPDDALMPAMPSGERVWSADVVRAWWGHSAPPVSRLDSAGVPPGILLDRSGDGVPEVEIHRTAGGFRWQVDEDQNGFCNIELFWEPAMELKSIRFCDSGGEVICYYDESPRISRIEVIGKDRNEREYFYLSGSFSLPSEGPLRWEDALDLSDADRLRWYVGQEAEYLKNCYSLKDSVTLPQNRLFREYTVVDGVIRRFREDSNFDGQYDRMVLLRDWLPYEGFRDLNYNGQYELREIYREGRLSGFEVRGDRVRIEEYIDLWNRKKFQLWDFDRTSFFDAVLIKTDERAVEEIMIKGGNSESDGNG